MKYEILETTDYDIFNTLLGNRDKKSESKIIDSIQRVGYVISPLIVNEKMEIIDGQNRLAALKALDMPVHYIVQPGLGIEACRQLNIGQTNWTMEDYVYSYAEMGNTSYQRLASLLNDYKKPLGLHGILAMSKPLMISEYGCTADRRLSRGELELSSGAYQTAIKRISTAIELGYNSFQKEKKMNGKIFWAAASYIFQHRQVSASAVIDSMRKYQVMIPSCSRVSEQLKYIDEAINKDAKRGTEKVFLTADFQRRLYLDEELEL